MGLRRSLWQWSDVSARRALERVGFSGVETSVMPVFSKALLARGTKPNAKKD